MGSDASPTERQPSLGEDEILHVLTQGKLALEGRLVGASNASFFGAVTLDAVTVPCIYKPVAGERPLWDFPEGNLASREMAARLVSEAAGWGVVPPTVLRDGRFGPGMAQQWIEESAEHELVDVVPADAELDGRIAVLEAEDGQGNPVLLVHADHPRLRDLAVFDVVVNNADRKGGHVLVAHDPLRADPSDGPPHVSHVWGCDHGVSFHVEDKLRTVLWGWAGEALREEDRTALHRLSVAFQSGLDEALAPLLTGDEIDAQADRVRQLEREGRMPRPGRSWPSIPWPAF